MEIADPAARGRVVLSLERAQQRFVDAKKQQFFADVVELFSAREVESAAQTLEERLQQEWACDLLARGGRDVLAAFCDEARRCLAALAAQYLREAEPPDLQHRQISSFLCTAERADLVMTQRVCSAVLEFAPKLNPFSSVISIEFDLMWNLRVSASALSEPMPDKSVPFTEATQHVLDMLTRYGFAQPVADEGLPEADQDAVEDDASGETRLRIGEQLAVYPGEALGAIRLLATCLESVPLLDADPA